MKIHHTTEDKRNQSTENSLHSIFNDFHQKVQRLRESDAKLREIINQIETHVREINIFNVLVNQDLARSPTRSSEKTFQIVHTLRPNPETIQILQIKPDEVDVLHLADLHMNLKSHHVWRGERIIKLQPREFMLLEFMMRHPEQVLTRSAILENVWGYRFDPNTNFIDVHISKLRKKIDAGSKFRLLRTVRNIGYVLTNLST